MTLSASTTSPGLWVNPAWNPGTPGTFAVVVGASRYAHLRGGAGEVATDDFGLRQLSTCALSAYRFFEWLRDDYANPASPLAMCWLLLSPSEAEQSIEPGVAEHLTAPTLSNLQRAVGEWYSTMKQLPSEAARGSRSLFWFSGHGFDVGTEHLLLPSDYLEPPLSMPDRAVSARRLVASMESLETRDQLFFLDTGREQLQQLQTFGITGMQLLPVPISRVSPIDRMSVTLGAAMPSGRAYEPGNPKDGISFFARAVIEGLRGEGGFKPDCSVAPCVVRLFPFVSFVQSRVQELLSGFNVTGQAVRLQLEGSSHDVTLTEVATPVAQTAPTQQSAQQSRQPAQASSARLPDAYALLIGVGGESEKDTALLRQVLTDQRYGGYGENRVRRIVGSEANREGIAAALQELSWITAPGERILIYCSNPGAQVESSEGSDALQSAIVPSDYEQRGFITTSELEPLLAALSGRSVLFLADYAHAARGLRVGTGHAAIAVGAEGLSYEEANVGADAASGRYARQLIEGLEGRAAGPDGTISTLDLFEYMSTRLWNEQDRVFLVGDSAADFVIASGSSPDAPAAPVSEDGFQYDVYVSAADRDTTTLHSRVLPRLIEAGLRIAILPEIDTLRGDTSRRAGVCHVATAERGIARSRRTLALLSEVYVRTVARTLGSVFDRALGAGAGRDRLVGARLGRWATARALAQMRLPSVLGDPGQWVTVKNALDVLVGDATHERAAASADVEPSEETETSSYALVIGIDTYQKSMALRGCARDANLIAELLSNGGTGETAYDVRVLTDADATREGILAALNEIAEAATGDSTVVIFFAGHGADTRDAGASAIEPSQSALVPVDYTEADRRFITTADLEAVLANMSARRIVVMADASYANRIMRGGERRVLISAGREGEHAYESRDREASGVGEFSSAVIDGLRGAAASDDGIVRVLDLYELVHRRVAAQGLQHPFIGGDLSENFTLAISPTTAPRDPAPAPDGYLYDAYLSFSSDDAPLVWKELGPRLATAGLRVAVSHDLDDARLYRVATPERGITQSRRYLVLVSPSSLAESTAEFERLASATVGLEAAASSTLRLTTTDDLERKIRVEPPLREWLRQAEGWTVGSLLEREDLIAELADRLRAPRPEPTRPATILISSDRHDRTAADRLAAALRGAGHTVLLTHELGMRKDGEAALEQAIDQCTIFVPVVSSASLTRETGGTLAEWQAAVMRSRRRPSGSRFILPVAIDDIHTLARFPAIPRELQEIQWIRVPDGEPTAEGLARITDIVWRERQLIEALESPPNADAQTVPRDLLPRLSASSRRALLAAEGYRRTGKAAIVDTGHLLAGLYEKPEGWAFTVMKAADFDGSWTGLLDTGRGDGIQSPEAARAPSSVLETMRIATTVADALAGARRLADENRATTIQARYVLAGLLGVPNDPAAAWMADRVDLEVEALRRLILAAVEGSPPVDAVKRLRRRGARLVLAPDPAHGGGAVYATAFSPDGSSLATAHYDGGVRLWNVADGAFIRLLGPIHEEGHGWTNCLAWSPNGDALVWGTQDGSILFWDARADTVGTIRGAHAGQVVSVRVTPDGRLLVSIGEDSAVQIRDWTDRELLGHGAGVYPVRRGISGLGFDVDRGLVFAASPDGTVTQLPPSAPGWA